MRTARILLFLLCVCVFCTPCFADPIVRPWRAAPAIVKQGEDFPLWFKAMPGEEITRVTLKGLFHSVHATTDKQTHGNYVYDSFADGTYSLDATVSVPSDCPEETYDLVVHTNKRETVAKKAVRVVQQFRKHYTFVHVTDAHITRNWVGNAKTGHPPGLEHVKHIVDVVNIIGPEFVIHTGDAIMDYTNGGILSAEQKWNYFYDGINEYISFHALDAPFFGTAGNHDHFGAMDKPAQQYVKYNGLRAYGFSYGMDRYMAFDDSLVPKDKVFPSDQTKVIESFLEREGPGNLRVVFQHQPNRLSTDFLDKHKVQMVFAGHIHRNTERFIGSTPTRLLVTKNAGRPLTDDPGWFRLVTVKDSKVIATVPLRYGDNTNQVPLMTRTFDQTNDGTVRENTTTIQNGFDVDFSTCHVRFVMSPGRYEVRNGNVDQIINGDNAAIYDVRVPVPAQGTAKVSIKSKP